MSDLNKYKAAVIKPQITKTYSPGKLKRHQQKRNKIGVAGFGKTWSDESVKYRVEMCWENKLLEQSNHQLHWIEVRKFKGVELKKYTSHFQRSEYPLKKGETIEYRHLLCYLDTFYAFHKPKINTIFIFPASKVKDEYIREPLAHVHFGKDFDGHFFNNDILAIYRNTIHHQEEKKGKLKKFHLDVI